MGNIGIVVFKAADMLFRFVDFMIFVRVIMSWIPMIDYRNPIAKFVYAITEPILGPIREIIRKSPIGSVGGMLDFSPIVAWIFFEIILMILGNILL